MSREHYFPKWIDIIAFVVDLITHDYKKCGMNHGTPKDSKQTEAHNTNTRYYWYIHISGDSSEPSGQSFSPSHLQPLDIHVIWSLQAYCFGLHVFGAGLKRKSNKKRRKH